MVIDLIAKKIKPKHMRRAKFSFYGKEGRVSPSFLSVSDAVEWLLKATDVNEFDVVISTDKEMLNGN